MFNRLAAIGLAAVSVAAAPMVASAASFGTNLITNGNAETGTTAGFTNLVGAFEAVAYGTGGGFPTSASPGASGDYFFAGGESSAFSSGTQLIDISDLSATIDLGGSTYDLSGLFGGFDSQADYSLLSISFLSASSASLGSGSVGQVSNGDRGNVTGLLARSTQGFVPIGTRFISANLSMTRLAGSYDDGYADDLSLKLTAGRGSTSGGVPEPASWALMLMGFGGLGAMLRSRRKLTA